MRSHILLLGFVAVFAVRVAAQNLAPQEFKNLQVMKNSTPAELMSSMQFMSSSLGVHCDHCHVEHAFEKDDKKPKQRAREMIRMVNSLNKTDLAGTHGITCYSCHRGLLIPKRTPVVAGDPTNTPVSLHLPASDAKARALLAKCFKAMGGSEALKKVTSEKKTGEVEISQGMRFDVTVQLKGALKRAEVIHFSNGDSVEAVEDGTGWRSVPGRPMQSLDAAEAEFVRQTAEPEFLNRIANYAELAVSPDLRINGKMTNVVRAVDANGALVRLYIDSDSGLLVRIVRYLDSPLGRNPTQIDFADYRDVAGTKQPFHWKVSQPQGSFSMQFDRIEVNVPIDDSIFQRPTAVRASE